jgi:hypothetical protein
MNSSSHRGCSSCEAAASNAAQESERKVRSGVVKNMLAPKPSPKVRHSQRGTIAGFVGPLEAEPETNVIHPLSALPVAATHREFPASRSSPQPPRGLGASAPATLALSLEPMEP